MKLYNQLTERQKDLLNRIDGYFTSNKGATIKDFRAVLDLLIFKYSKTRKGGRK